MDEYDFGGQHPAFPQDTANLGHYPGMNKGLYVATQILASLIIRNGVNVGSTEDKLVEQATSLSKKLLKNF